MCALWRIELLGGLRAVRGEQVVTRFETRKTAALLAYLACHRHRSHPRELLAELLWPEEDPAATRVRLRAALVALRKVLEGEDLAGGTVLLADWTSVRLSPEAATTDVAEFEAALQHARAAPSPAESASSLTKAVDLYGGELLPGLYEEWITPERERLADAQIGALQQLADLLLQTGDPDAAIGRARQAVAVDPLRETSHGQLMRLYARAGRRTEALRQYRELERLLKEELNTRPSDETSWLAREIAAGEGRLTIEDWRMRIADSPDVGRAKIQGQSPAARTARTNQSAISNHHSSISNLPSQGLEPIGGAVPLDSPFYVERRADAEFQRAITRRDSIVLLKGPRQVGKTSLLARGLQQAREAGAGVVLTDFQKLTPDDLATAETLFMALGEAIADELDLDLSVRALWKPERGWSVNFERFLRREVLEKQEMPLVWGLDEVDRLFAFPFANEVFGLFRSWHNERALRPAAPWRRLTLAIAYATEAHLFITDVHQSPFNVGTRLELEDFTREQVADLNHRYRARSASGHPPLKTPAEVERFMGLVGGHPFLVRCGLDWMATERSDIAGLEAQAGRDTGPFGDHLRRLLHSLSRDPELAAAAQEALQCGRCPDAASFYRLRSAGVLLGDSAAEVRPRCRLYRLYLEPRLG